MAVLEPVRFPSSDGVEIRGAIARPDSGASRGSRLPGVVVIHEAFGLTDDIRRIAGRFASAGYVALAPDLYSRGGPKLLCVARTFRTMRAGAGPAFEDLEAARKYLASLPDVDGERLGVAGFCLGGGFALLVALRGAYRASAPFYGAVPKEAGALEGICPVVGSFGGRDRTFGPQGRRLERHLAALGAPHDVKIYEDAGHSFMSHHDPGLLRWLGAIGPMKVGYDESAAEDSWKRMLDFFQEHL